MLKYRFHSQRLMAFMIKAIFQDLTEQKYSQMRHFIRFNPRSRMNWNYKNFIQTPWLFLNPVRKLFRIFTKAETEHEQTLTQLRCYRSRNPFNSGIYGDLLSILIWRQHSVIADILEWGVLFTLACRRFCILESYIRQTHSSDQSRNLTIRILLFDPFIRGTERIWREAFIAGNRYRDIRRLLVSNLLEYVSLGPLDLEVANKPSEFSDIS